MSTPALRFDLDRLADELRARGIAVGALGTIGDGDAVRVVTYDAAGVPVALPPAAQAVVAAHQPPAVDDEPALAEVLAEVLVRRGMLNVSDLPEPAAKRIAALVARGGRKP